MHQISRTPSNSPLEEGETRLPPFQGGTEGGENLHGVSTKNNCQTLNNEDLSGIFVATSKNPLASKLLNYELCLKTQDCDRC